MTDILMVSGRSFDLVDVETHDYQIEDIAHALSHLCRFTGHTRTLYTVAQHSVFVSMLVPPEQALAGLLHDAAEAYIGDVASPLKSLLPDYQAIEARIERALRRRFGVPADLSPEVKLADRVMLATERRDLMPASAAQWARIAGIEPLGQRLVAWSPEMSRVAFLQRFAELTREGVCATSAGWAQPVA